MCESYEQIKLSNCNHCGGNVEVLRNNSNYYYIGCKNCDMKSILMLDANKLVEMWNSYIEDLRKEGI